MAFVYILECSDGSLYTGSTDRDVEHRVWQHNHDDAWAANHTRRHRPVNLVWCASVPDAGRAFALEKQIQGWSRAKKLALIDGRLEDLPALSRSRSGQTP
ncbi:excinuclease ABC subunit C [Microbacterium mangrovi]|uniref:Excinuclease ABC subunit C n=1 Tax=Microbacterium mangrovi TaxID=1348253 RepID=A0A0B2AC49_9MICO|nr:GIY-YIG nuclease family protein [Microbacterium mangrovi]KHK99162.1 excinuclease ABC subunit C [Microbacterium mangrovi]